MGRCNRPSGLLRHFSHADFVIWFAANNCRDVAITRWQMEALIFHELKHAKMEDGEAVLVPHEWEDSRKRLTATDSGIADLSRLPRRYRTRSRFHSTNRRRLENFHTVPGR